MSKPEHRKLDRQEVMGSNPIVPILHFPPLSSVPVKNSASYPTPVQFVHPTNVGLNRLYSGVTDTERHQLNACQHTCRGYKVG